MWVGLNILSLLQTIEDMIATTKDVATYHPAYEVSSWLAVFIFCRMKYNVEQPSLVTQLNIISSVKAVTLIIFS